MIGERAAGVEAEKQARLKAEDPSGKLDNVPPKFSMTTL